SRRRAECCWAPPTGRAARRSPSRSRGPRKTLGFRGPVRVQVPLLARWARQVAGREPFPLFGVKSGSFGPFWDRLATPTSPRSVQKSAELCGSRVPRAPRPLEVRISPPPLTREPDLAGLSLRSPPPPPTVPPTVSLPAL